MKVYKNMLGDNSKIHIDEIATKLAGKPVKLSEAVVVDEGLSASGNYVRFGNGFQVCWIRDTTVVYNDKRILNRYWTFPVAFSRNVFATAIRTNYWGAINITNSSISADADETRAHVRLWSPAGQTFTSSDVANIRILAIGYWK